MRLVAEDASWYVAVEDRPRADISMRPNGYVVFRGTASVTDAMLDLTVTPSEHIATYYPLVQKVGSPYCQFHGGFFQSIANDVTLRSTLKRCGLIESGSSPSEKSSPSKSPSPSHKNSRIQRSPDQGDQQRRTPRNSPADQSSPIHNKSSSKAALLKSASATTAPGRGVSFQGSPKTRNSLPQFSDSGDSLGSSLSSGDYNPKNSKAPNVDQTSDYIYAGRMMMCFQRIMKMPRLLV